MIRFANVHKQKPLFREESLFIAEYPRIAETILTKQPPKITIFKPYIERPPNSKVSSEPDALIEK